MMTTKFSRCLALALILSAACAHTRGPAPSPVRITNHWGQVEHCRHVAPVQGASGWVDPGMAHRSATDAMKRQARARGANVVLIHTVAGGRYTRATGDAYHCGGRR